MGILNKAKVWYNDGVLIELTPFEVLGDSKVWGALIEELGQYYLTHWEGSPTAITVGKQYHTAAYLHEGRLVNYLVDDDGHVRAASNGRFTKDFNIV